MYYNAVMRLFFSTLVLFVCAAAASAQIQLVNPGFPASESIVYSEKIGSKVTPLKLTVAAKSEDGRSFLEARSLSSDQDLMYRVDAKDMMGFYSDSTDRYPDANVRRTWELQKASPKGKSDELVISDLSSLSFVLRGFPWGKTNYAKVKFVGASDTMDGFAFELNVQGKETVKASGKSYECWKVEFGLSGILGGFVPKSRFWYTTQAPYYLVKYEGNQGGPGSPVRTLELVSYTSGG